MSAIKAEAELSIRSDRFVAGINQARDAITNLDKTSDSAGQNVQNQNKKTSASFASVGATTFGLITNVTALSFAYRDLNDNQIRIDRLSLTIKKKQEDYNAALQKGDESASQLANRLEELRILQERHKDAIEDADKANTMFILNLGTMAAVTIPSTITAMRGLIIGHATATGVATAQTAANAGLTASFMALTRAMLTNPLGIALVAGSVGALALYSTNVFGVKDKVDGLLGSFVGLTPSADDFHNNLQNKGVSALQSYGNAANDVTRSMESTSEQIKRTNEAMDKALSRLDNLSKTVKKNDDEIEGFTENTLILGTIADATTSLINEMPSTRKLQEDRRRVVPTALVGKAREEQRKRIIAEAGMRFAQRANQKQNISFADSLSKGDRKLLAHASMFVNRAFEMFRPFGDSKDATLRGLLRDDIGGISQSEAGNIINAGRGGGSTKSRSGSSKARSGGFGGNKDPFTSMPFDLALARAMGLPISSASSGTTAALQARASRQINSMLQLIQEEGFGIPSITGMQSESRVRAALAQVQSLYTAAANKRNTRLGGFAAATGFTIDIVKQWLDSPDGEMHLNNIASFKRRQSEEMASIAL